MNNNTFNYRAGMRDFLTISFNAENMYLVHKQFLQSESVNPPQYFLVVFRSFASLLILPTLWFRARKLCCIGDLWACFNFHCGDSECPEWFILYIITFMPCTSIYLWSTSYPITLGILQGLVLLSVHNLNRKFVISERSTWPVGNNFTCRVA